MDQTVLHKGEPRVHTTIRPLFPALAMIIVGSSVVAEKVMVTTLPVHFSSALRFALALAVVLPLLWLREGGLPRLPRREWFLLAVQSLYGSFLFTVCLLYDLRLISSASASIITSTTPACMALLAWIVMGERPTHCTMGVVLFCVAGLASINAESVSHAGSHPLAGNLLVLAAVILEPLFLLLRKSLKTPISPLAAATVVSLFGLLWFVPGAIYEATTMYISTASQEWLAVV